MEEEEEESNAGSEERQEPLADARFDLLAFAADLHLLPFVPRIQKVVALVEKDVFPRDPFDGETTCDRNGVRI